MSHIVIERNFNPQIILARWGKANEKVAEHLRTDIKNYLDFAGLEAIKRYFPKGGIGALEASLKVFDESVGYQIRFSIHSDNPELEPALKSLEYGSPPHTITPSIAKALAFQPHLMRFYLGGGLVPMAIRGDQIYRARVEHPGNRPYRMFQNGLIDIEPELLQVVKNIVKTVINDTLRER